jgi:phosphatidylserine decarboxylase
MSMAEVPYRVGKWLPSDQAVLDRFLAELIEDVEGKAAKLKAAPPFHPVIQEFQKLIENDPQIYMWFNQMFSEVPKRFQKSPTGKPQIRDYHQMLRLMNAILTRAPKFNKTALVGFPINAILDWSMATAGGFAAFLDARVNGQLKKILNEWGRFLKSKDSRCVLTDDADGWFGPAASEAMPDFDREFQCDPKAPHHGFTSWDDFFTRQFREGVRPVASPEDPNVVVNACESAPYKLAHEVKRRDRFWIKAQPYSLEHMLANDELADRFEGGSIYQAFLSALSYHRWHSPVSGHIVKTEVLDGTYYAEARSEGFDPAGPNESQGYITEVAARAKILIKADNPKIGLMYFLAVGMSEVSTNEITVREGQHVEKGQELGMFHFGGSTHCLIFRPGVNVAFDMHGQKPGLDSQNIPINSRIATVC